MDSNFWYRGTKTVDFRSIPGMAGDRLSWSDIMALLGPALTRRRGIDIPCRPLTNRNQNANVTLYAASMYFARA